LDTRVTPELEAEGVARDTVRAIQGIRKQLDLNVADRITVVIEAEDSVAEALGAHRDLISAETLATGLDFASLDGAGEVFAPEELPSGTRIS
ncbi:DUF5915 domain-containing protein, partial [Enterococcus faecium]